MKGELAMRTGNYQGMSYEEDQTALNSTRILQLKEEGKYRKSYLLLGLCLCMGSRDALPLLGPLPLQGLQRWHDLGPVPLHGRENGHAGPAQLHVPVQATWVRTRPPSFGVYK